MAVTLKQTTCALLIAALTGCSVLRPVATPREFIPAARPDRIWVTRTDNSKLMVEGPRLLGDTLVGWVAGRYEEILLPETRYMSVRQSAPKRTALLIVGGVVAGAGLLYLLAGNGPSASGSQNEDPSSPSTLRYPRGLR